MNRAELAELARAIRRQSKPPTLVRGTIVSVETDSCTIDIQDSGLVIPGIRWLDTGYTPTAEDSIWLIPNGTSDFILLGKLFTA